MQIRLDPARTAERPVLGALMQLYVYDFSEMLGLDLQDSGYFAAPALDPYWEAPDHHPFVIRVDGRLAGFALIRRGSRLSDDPEVWDVAEYFVLRRYRRAGVGTEAARALFATHPGTWEVRQQASNPNATAFWRRAIGAFTGGAFAERTLDDARWCGQVQRFISG